MTEDFHANLREELEKFNLATNLQLDFTKFVRYLITIGLFNSYKLDLWLVSVGDWLI